MIKGDFMKIDDRRGHIALCLLVLAVIVFAVGAYWMTSASRSNNARLGVGVPLGSSTSQ